MARKITSSEKKELLLIGDAYRASIYSSDNLPSMLTNFSEKLKAINGDISKTILSEVLHFKDLSVSRNFFSIFRSWINELYDILLDKLPESVTFTIECRRKSAQGVVRKLLRNYLDGSSVNLFDLLAFRTIFDSLESAEELEKVCYTVKKICITFFRDKLCILCTPNKQVGSDPLVKNYIEVPKSNGYQSIHLGFRTFEMEFFEVQIRTLQMHELAEYGRAAHLKYKDKVDSLVSEYIYFEPEKVHMPHFKLLVNNSVYDKIGLLDALHIEQRSKTF